MSAKLALMSLLIKAEAVEGLVQRAHQNAAALLQSSRRRLIKGVAGRRHRCPVFSQRGEN